MRGQRRPHLITIQQKIEQVTEDGAPNGFVWIDLYSAIDAGLIPLSGHEFVTADAEQKEVTTRCELPWLPTTLDTAMRILHLCCDQLAHNIVAILPDPTYQRHQNLMLSAGLRYDEPAEVDEIDGGNAATTEDAFVGGGGA